MASCRYFQGSGERESPLRGGLGEGGQSNHYLLGWGKAVEGHRTGRWREWRKSPVDAKRLGLRQPSGALGRGEHSCNQPENIRFNSSWSVV